VKQFVRTFVFGSVLAGVVAFAAPASAQDLSVGYQWQRLSSEGEDTNLPLGFNVDASFPVNESIGIVGQVDWSRKSESGTFLGTSFDTTLNLTSFAGGVRWTAANASTRPFVQALFGASHGSISCEVAGLDCDDIVSEAEPSSTNALLQLGGGVTFPLTETIAGLAQFDYRRIFVEDSGVNNIRFVIGARIALR
jgi:hypothetical protein